MSQATCAGADCAKILSKWNKSGLCRRCALLRNHRDPEMNARRIAAMTVAINRPDVVARKSASVSKRRRQKMANDPAFAEAQREHGRRLGKSNIGNLAAPAGSEPRRRAGQTLSNRALGWCPPEYREEYERLNHLMKVPSVEARAIIEEQIAKDKARREAGMSPFERQMDALRKGARLIGKPRLKPKDYDFTLGGVSSL